MTVVLLQPAWTTKVGAIEHRPDAASWFPRAWDRNGPFEAPQIIKGFDVSVGCDPSRFAFSSHWFDAREVADGEWHELATPGRSRLVFDVRFLD